MPRKLKGASYPHRYLLRVNDNYRVIFDLVENKLVYRALSSHEESYRRAKVLPPPDLDKVANFSDIYKPAAKYRPRVEKPPAGTISTILSLPDESICRVSEKASNPEVELDSNEESYVLLQGANELTVALGSDIAEWMLFLPQEHRRYITQQFNGPARVFGPSGTGKTCILLHRAAHLAQSLDAQTLIVTFRPTLAKVITKLKERLCARSPRTNSLITVLSLDSLARQISGNQNAMSAKQHESLIKQSMRAVASPPATLLRKLRRDQDLVTYSSNEVLNWIKGTAYKSRDIYQALDFRVGKGNSAPQSEIGSLASSKHMKV